MELTYQGAETGGVSVEFVYFPHGEPVEVDDDLGKRLVKEYPDAFHKATRATKKGAE